MIINCHAGHNPDGKIACGAVGLIKESTEARRVKDEVIYQLRALGHTVNDCTCENGKNQSDVLKKIMDKSNIFKRDMDISIHFNAGGGKGVEVLVYGSSSKALACAKNTVNCISGLGFKNRGVKYRPDLYVLRKATAPAMLIECCFVDSSDVTLYNYKTMAQAIVKGITGQSIKPIDVTTPEIHIRIIVNELNIRAGAGTGYKITGVIKDKGVYTIVETKGNWGRLKSGAGWVNISEKYVKKV